MCSRVQPAREHREQEQSCCVPTAQGQPNTLQHQPGTAVIHKENPTAFPGDPCPTHRWSLLVLVSFEQVPSHGKHLRLHIPPPVANYSRTQTHSDVPQLLPKHPSPLADAPCLGWRGSQRHHPAIHEFSKRKRVHQWKLKALCKVRLDVPWGKAYRCSAAHLLNYTMSQLTVNQPASHEQLKGCHHAKGRNNAGDGSPN